PVDWMLPGVAPTGKRVEVAFAVVVGFKDGKISHEHIYWDQACLLEQIGLLDRTALPITGIEQALNLLDRSYATNTLLARVT
ncbi:MAG: ester cyclase, partial [Candidatus Cybelea sp.]